MSSAQETRVVLVKPGDVLVFGNVKGLPPGQLDPMAKTLREHLGIEHVVFFADDIDMAAVPGAVAAAVHDDGSAS